MGRCLSKIILSSQSFFCKQCRAAKANEHAQGRGEGREKHKTGLANDFHEVDDSPFVDSFNSSIEPFSLPYYIPRFPTGNWHSCRVAPLDESSRRPSSRFLVRFLVRDYNQTGQKSVQKSTNSMTHYRHGAEAVIEGLKISDVNVRKFQRKAEISSFSFHLRRGSENRQNQSSIHQGKTSGEGMLRFFYSAILQLHVHHSTAPRCQNVCRVGLQSATSSLTLILEEFMLLNL